jgi:hypothetical protein
VRVGVGDDADCVVCMMCVCVGRGSGATTDASRQGTVLLWRSLEVSVSISISISVSVSISVSISIFSILTSVSTVSVF